MQQITNELNKLTSAVENLTAALKSLVLLPVDIKQPETNFTPETTSMEQAVEKQPAAEVPASTQAPAAITFEQIKAALIAYDKKNGTPALRALLAQFYANRISEINPEHYAKVMEVAGAQA